MKHLTLNHCAFHVQIPLHTLTVYIGSLEGWFGSYLCHFFIRCKSLSFLLSQFRRPGTIRTSMKGGKGVDIHFNRLKWFTLKINKYQQTTSRDQLTSAVVFFRWCWYETRKTEKENYGDELCLPADCLFSLLNPFNSLLSGCFPSLSSEQGAALHIFAFSCPAASIAKCCFHLCQSHNTCVHIILWV